MPALRTYQADACAQIDAAWSRDETPCLVLPTGGGKTVVFAHVIGEHVRAGRGPAVAVAHRRELVGQMSLALAREGVSHRIVAPPATIRAIVRTHVEVLGRAWYSPTAETAVAGVDSIAGASAHWCDSIRLWVQDEAHHLLRGNKWGKAIARFGHSRGLGVTATPGRADGRGLGRHADGVFDSLVSGPSLGDLQALGYLTPYRIYAPPAASLQLDRVAVSRATGDYSAPQLRAEVHRARITGDVVAHYQRHAAGRRGVTFAVDVDAAAELAAAYCAAGVPARMVHAGTPAAERGDAVRLLERGDVLQLVNVDIFGEGFDLPAIEAVSFARPTASYPLFAQQFGRALRPLEGKTHAIILDHVGNVIRHGLPDPGPAPSLDARERRRGGTRVEGLRVCPACTAVYDRVRTACPYCGHAGLPADRSRPDLVAGDLTELDADALAALRGAVDRVDRPAVEVRAELVARGVPELGVRRCLRLHGETQHAQAGLRSAIDWWAGVERTRGRDDREILRLFYSRWGIDVLSARALRSGDALDLARRILEDLPYPAQVLA